MRRWIKGMPLSMDEVKMLIKKEDKKSKWIWVGIGFSIICSLVAIALWVCNRRDKDMEHYFEYFDDEDFEDEDFEYEYEDEEEEDEEDEEQEVEYVEIVEEDEEE